MTPGQDMEWTFSYSPRTNMGQNLETTVLQCQLTSGDQYFKPTSIIQIYLAQLVALQLTIDSCNSQELIQEFALGGLSPSPPLSPIPFPLDVGPRK